ncbi:NAD-dependent epimerase/dehydratase family protein [Flaviaesturariibacter flavus]|uniref:NAD-dependent epimerase/dehydratase family protein n=1 Tax=Flaviaesturariibacter flavus TaxID=2502780 RepID=A0A4R1B8N6_9BACT|nr:NAD-dependent epimerase/dehydratase family protein [Flaviaesturariibacter flavus]TCJ13115.1 NAD-dependent epimerase/dehydratase family protein [Flaviaesturariibacter flavus]
MVLITGGTGFLGAYILKELVGRGLPVRAIRRSAKLPFFIDAEILNKVEWVEGDVLDVVSLQDAMQGVDRIIHAAAVVSFHGADRARMRQVNIDGTANVVNVALEEGVRRLVHISSVAALGRTREGGLVDESKKWSETKSNTAYARSKYAAEIEVWRGFSEGLEGAVLNPSTILGFGDWHQSSCAIFRNAWKGAPWYTEGVNGFVGVEDCARASVEILESDISEKRFIVNGDNWSFHKLLDTMADGFGKPRPSREASPLLGSIAWRMEALKSALTGQKALLTKESARVAQSRTTFSNHALLEALPGFAFAPLEEVIENACARYKEAVSKGVLSV